MGLLSQVLGSNSFAYRAVRYNPVTEAAHRFTHPERTIQFPEIDLTISAGPGDVVIDAGANIGDVTSRCARTGAKVYAFEPGVLAFSILKRRFALVHNVRCINKGLMDRNCTLSLTTPQKHRGYDDFALSLSSSFVVTYEGQSRSVECIDIAEVIKGPVKLLKLDIEGAEISVLNRLIDTGTIGFIDHVLVETHERLSPELAEQTADLRKRIDSEGLSNKVRLDWL